MVSKSELHKQYVKLIQQGKKEEGQEVLKQIWNFKKDSKEVIKEVEKVSEAVVVKEKKEVSKKKEISLNDLANIEGIGKTTLKDIKGVFKSFDELVEYISSGRELPFRSDIDKKIMDFVKNNGIL